MRKDPMNEHEQHVVATMLGRIGDIIAHHAPERVVKAHARLVELLKLPAPGMPNLIDNYNDLERWAPTRETPRASERLSEDELHILIEWLETVIEIYNGRVSAPAIDAHIKLDRLLWALAHMPIKTKPWWDKFDKERRQIARG